MARIRTVKPEIWLSPQVMNLAHGARLLFLGLITQADDAGRGCADARRLKATVFPGDDVKAADVRKWLDECVHQRLIILYDDPVHGVLYALPSWSAHQSIDRPRPSSYPPPPEDSTSSHRGIVEASTKTREGREGNGKEGKGREQTRERAPEPDCPEGLDQGAWSQWLSYRIELRKPLKPVSIPAAQRELAAFGGDQVAVVEQSIANGYQGLFALKSQRTNGNSDARPTRYAQLRRKLDEHVAETSGEESVDEI